MWLDGKDRRFIEESGVMNIMFNINGTAITPALSGTILPGVTRDSVLTLLREMKIKLEERPVSLDEVLAAHSNATLLEAFGIGTAAIIAPIAAIGHHGKDHEIPTASPDEFQAANPTPPLPEPSGIAPAAIIAPIAAIGHHGKDHEIPTASTTGLAHKLKHTLTAIQTGRAPDTHNWLLHI